VRNAAFRRSFQGLPSDGAFKYDQLSVDPRSQRRYGLHVNTHQRVASDSVVAKGNLGAVFASSPSSPTYAGRDAGKDLDGLMREIARLSGERADSPVDSGSGHTSHASTPTPGAAFSLVPKELYRGTSPTPADAKPAAGGDKPPAVSWAPPADAHLFTHTYRDARQARGPSITPARQQSESVSHSGSGSNSASTSNSGSIANSRQSSVNVSFGMTASPTATPPRIPVLSSVHEDGYSPTSAVSSPSAYSRQTSMDTHCDTHYSSRAWC
jgi:hypothetical protein